MTPSTTPPYAHKHCDKHTYIILIAVQRFLSLVHILFVHNPQVYIMLQCCITCYLQKVGLSCNASAFLDPVHDPAASS